MNVNWTAINTLASVIATAAYILTSYSYHLKKKIILIFIIIFT